MEIGEYENLPVGDARRALGELNNIDRLFDTEMRSLAFDDDNIGMAPFEHSPTGVAGPASSVRTNERSREQARRLSLPRAGRPGEQKGVNGHVGKASEQRARFSLADNSFEDRVCSDVCHSGRPRPIASGQFETPPPVGWRLRSTAARTRWCTSSGVPEPSMTTQCPGSPAASAREPARTRS